MFHPSNLLPYQQQSIDFLKQTPKCGLFLKPSGGKTVITLSAISHFFNDFAISKVLIIAPKRVVETVWEQEAKLWSHITHLTFSRCTGSPQKRLKQLNVKADIFLINFENIQWLIQNHEATWDFDMIVIDESSKMKSHSTARLKALLKVHKHHNYVVLLTGTPAPNKISDLWSQLFLIDKGRRLGKTITEFRNKYQRQSYRSPHSWDDLPGAWDAVQEKIADVCFSIPDEVYLKDLPKVVNAYMRVKLPNKARIFYNKLLKEFIAEINNEKDKKIVCKTKAAQVNKLLQACTGMIYNDDREPLQLHDAKLEALAEFVELNPKLNVMVAYSFVPDIAALKASFPYAETLNDGKHQEGRWNAGEIKMLLVHPASGGYGLNLQYGSSVLIWYGLNWSLEYYQQLNGRLVRHGQRAEVVHIIHLVVEDGMDEIVLQGLKRKETRQQQLMGFLQLSCL